MVRRAMLRIDVVGEVGMKVLEGKQSGRKRQNSE